MRDFLKLRAIGVTTRLALLVREPVRFWLRVACRTSRIGRYRLRGSDVVIYLRHRTVDIMTLDQIVRLGHYQLPVPLAKELRAIERPLRVVDLGANIGLFGAYVRRLFPDADVTAVEPHPANVKLLKRTIQANGGHAWRLVAACADVQDRTVPFSTGSEFTTSRIEPGAATAVTVPAVDVFPLLHEVDFLKVDIEGAEWPILLDSRFRSIAAKVIALEYHAYECPVDDPGSFARSLLVEAGYETAEADFDATPGHGMLWAWRRA
jgi:FkbM family methyltransferase